MAAVTADGVEASTGNTLVASLAPGGVSGASGLRSENGESAYLEWKDPSRSIGGPVSTYRVVVTEMASGKTLVKRESMDAAEKFGGLDPKRVYVAKVTATSAFGSCVTGTSLLGANRPGSPTFTVARAAAQPASAVVTWGVPAWQGYGPVTSYLVGYKRPSQRGYTWVTTDASRRSLTVPSLDPAADWTFVMRANSSDDPGLLSSPSC